MVSEGGDTTGHAAGAERTVGLEHEVRGGADDNPAGQGGVLYVHGVELPALAEDGGADEGAHGGGQQGDVGVDV